MDRNYKFSMSKDLFEAFYRLFPGLGERRRFLIDQITLAITKAEKKKDFNREIFDAYEEGE